MEYTAQSAEKVKKQTLDSVTNCTSNAYEIISQDDAASIKKYMTHNGVSYLKKDFISGLGTTVHECLHGYDNALGEGMTWDDNTYPIAYFIDKDLVIAFEGRRLFKTDKLHSSFFPKDVKKMFRYGTYVYSNGPAEASSNQWGIYGLLEEFNAYYHDMKAQIEYYNCHFSGKQSELMFGNEINAYYEFNTFMAYYLLYAKKYKKDDYKYIMANTELRKAYSLMEINWQSLLTEIFEERDLGLRFADVSEDAALFTPELQLVMTEFRLSDTQLSEYASFRSKRPTDMSLVNKNLSWAGSDEVVDLLFPEMESLNEGMARTVAMMEQITFGETGYYYVSILISSDPDELTELILSNAIGKYKDAGMFIDEQSKIHVYLNRFKEIKEANDYIKKVKDEFPNAALDVAL
jgi:hypothetical protein